MTPRCAWTVCFLLALLVPLEVYSQDLNLADALEEDTTVASKASPTPAPAEPEGEAGDSVIDDLLKVSGTTSPVTEAPTKVEVPKAPQSSKAPVKPKPKPADDDLNLADALEPDNDIGGKDNNKGQGGRFSDDDLADVGKDSGYKPDKGKGASEGDQIQNDNSSGTSAEVGTIAGIVSAVAMALVGAVSSYISYQKKKLCFGIQQSLNADMVKAENPDAVVSTEPVQQTLLEPASAEPPNVENTV